MNMQMSELMMSSPQFSINFGHRNEKKKKKKNVILAMRMLDLPIPEHGPQKMGTVNYSWFSDPFAFKKFNKAISFFTLLDRASFSHKDNTKIHQIWLRTFYLMSNFLWSVIFGISPEFSRYFRGTNNDKLMANPENDSP